MGWDEQNPGVRYCETTGAGLNYGASTCIVVKYGTSKRPGVNQDTNRVHLILTAYRPGTEVEAHYGAQRIIWCKARCPYRPCFTVW